MSKVATGYRGESATLLDSGMGGAGPEIGFGRLHLYACVDLDEPFRRKALLGAVDGVVRRFPVLGCRYVHGFWRDRWIPHTDGGPGDAVEMLEGVVDLEDATRGIVRRELDPGIGWPWRVSQITGAGGSRLVVTVLHAVADGAGAMTAVAELGRLLCGGKTSEPARGGRGLSPILRSLRIRALPVLAWETAVECLRPLSIPFVARVGDGSRQAAPPTADPVFRSVEVDIASDSALRRRCRAQGGTVNDALVAATAVAVERQSRSGLVGAFFTVDLRRYIDDGRQRVANLSSFNTLLLPRKAVGTFKETVREVARRTARHKRRFPGLGILLAMVASCGYMPFGLARLAGRLGTRWMRLLATRGLLVTNIGPLDPYLEAFGARATTAFVIGPFLHGSGSPVITATAFRDRLWLLINSFETHEPEIDALSTALRKALDVPPYSPGS